MLSLSLSLSSINKQKSIVQSVIFLKELYTIQEAVNWLSSHGYVHETVENTKDSHIFILEKEKEKAFVKREKISIGITFKTYA